MPLNVVKTPADEKKWEKAEALAAARVGKDSPRYYAYVMGIYKRMKPDYEFKGKRAADIDLSKGQMDALHKDGEVVVDGVKLTFGKTAFNKYNAPELVSQLMAVLQKEGLDDAVNQLKMKKVPQIIDKAWRQRKEASMDQPLMLQPDYGEHPCQHGGACQCGGACQGRVAARAVEAWGPGFLSDSKKKEAFRLLGVALGGRPDVAQKIKKVLERHGLSSMAKVMWNAQQELQADLDLAYMD